MLIEKFVSAMFCANVFLVLVWYQIFLPERLHVFIKSFFAMA